MVVVFSADPESSRVAVDSDQIDSDGASATSTTPIASTSTFRVAPSPHRRFRGLLCALGAEEDRVGRPQRGRINGTASPPTRSETPSG